MTTEHETEKAVAHTIDIATRLTCQESGGKLDENSETDRKAVGVALITLYSEGGQFAETFSAGIKKMLGFATGYRNEEDWARRAAIALLLDKYSSEFGQYLYAAVEQWTKFPDKALRDKLRKAVGG